MTCGGARSLRRSDRAAAPEQGPDSKETTAETPVSRARRVVPRSARVPAPRVADRERRLRMVVDATSALGVSIVAMGVEDDATLTMLRALGVFLAQGYLFAPPLGVKELTEWSAGRARAV